MTTDAAHQPPVDHATAAVMARIASLSLDSSRVPVSAVLSDIAPLRDDEALDALAGLVEGGWLSEWEGDDGTPGVILTAWWAAALGLRLNADSSRWTAAEAYRGQSRRRGRTLTITEADLRDECDVPLDEITEEAAGERARRRDPGPNAAGSADGADLDHRIRLGRAAARVAKDRGVSDRQLLGIFADAIGFHDWSCGDDLPRGGIVLHGVPAWPLPGQSRAPGGPHRLEAPQEGEEAKARANEAGDGACRACRGLPLAPTTTCDACSRGGMDARVPAEIRSRIAASYRRREEPGPAGRAPEKGRKGGEGRGDRGKVYHRGGGLRGGIGA